MLKLRGSCCVFFLLTAWCDAAAQQKTASRCDTLAGIARQSYEATRPTGPTEGRATLIEQVRQLDLIRTTLQGRLADTLDTGEKPDSAKKLAAEALADRYRWLLEFLADPFRAQTLSVYDVSDLTVDFAVVGSSQSAAEHGLVSQAAFINGLTDFVINRARDEVSVAFLIGLRDRMENDDLLSKLFGQTLTVAKDLEAHSAKQLLQPLRSALTADLHALPSNLTSDSTAMLAAANVVCGWVEKHRPAVQDEITTAFTYFQRHRDEIRLLVAATKDLVNGAPPLATIERLALLPAGSFPDDANVRYALVTVGSIAREFRLDPEGTRSVFKNPMQRGWFLALLKRDLGASIHGSSAAAWAQTTFTTLQTRVADVALNLEELVQSAEGVRTAAKDSDAKGLLSAAAKVSNAGRQVINSIAPLINDSTILARWEELQKKIEHIEKLQAAIAAHEYIDAVTELDLTLKEFVGSGLPERPLKAVTFAATIASAETAEEVEAALNAAAVPVTSFRAKRSYTTDEYHGTFGLNAYVGGLYGREHTTGAGKDGALVVTGGLSVPVGIEASLPMKTCCVRSLSAFVSILDLGTIASFRFSDDTTTEDAPSVTFKQVLAPGVFGMLGISEKFPITIGFGAQYIPRLRRKTADGKTIDAIRYGVIAAIDVPIFRF